MSPLWLDLDFRLGLQFDGFCDRRVFLVGLLIGPRNNIRIFFNIRIFVYSLLISLVQSDKTSP